MSEKDYRKALLTVKRLNRDAGGNAQLRGAMDSFARQRQQNFDRPANGGDAEALALANSNSSPPQLLVADPPQQQQSTSKDMASEATDFGSALDDGIGMLTGRDTTKPSSKSAPNAPAAQMSSATPSQGQPSRPATATPPSKDQQSSAFNMIDRLVKVHGWTPEAASIAAGNAMQESSFNPSAGGDPSIPGGSHGMFQWNRDRLANLQNFAQQQGTSWKDPNTQIDYFAQEAKKMVPSWPSQTDLSQARPISKAFEGYGIEGNRVPDAQNIYKAYQNRPAPSAGPVSEADIPQDDSVPQAKRGGFMRRHFDDGGGAGDGGGDGGTGGPGTASGDGDGDGNGDGTGTSVSANSGNVGYGSGADGDNGAGFASGATSGSGGGVSAGHGAPGAASGVGVGPGGGGGGAAASTGAAAAGSGGAGPGGTGGGGGTASGGSGHGGTGPGGTVGGNGGPMAGSVQGVAQQQLMTALQAAMNHQAISTSGDPGVASLGVPPGLLSGVSTAVSPVTVSQLGPATQSPAHVQAINALMAAQHGGTGQSTGQTGFGNVGFGGGSPGQTTGGFGGNTNSTGAEGVSTAGLGQGSGATGASTGPSSVLGYTAPPGTAPAVMALMAANQGTQAQQNQGQQTASPAAVQANNGNNTGGGRNGSNVPVSGAGRHNRGGMVNRASGGEVASMPTAELIAKALQIIARRKAASGGTQKAGTTTTTAKNPLSGIANAGAITAGESGTPQTLQQLYGSTPGSDATNPSGNGAEFWNEWGGFMGPSGAIENDALTRGSSLYGGGSGSQAPAAPPAPITPALDGQTIGNASAGGSGDRPIGSLANNPNAGAATGPVYDNTLNQALGTNAPTMNQVFGFNYPVPPAPKPQPQGPVSQDQINASYGMTNGAQFGTGTDQGMFAAGGAIIMDALTRANRRKAKGKR